MTVDAVFDTVTLLQAAANPSGPAGKCLQLVSEARVTLHMSAEGIAEIEDVLGRTKVRKRVPQLTDEAVATFLTGLRAQAQLVSEVPGAFRYDRDPDDEHILNLALLTRAACIVTRDNDLLDFKGGKCGGPCTPDPSPIACHTGPACLSRCGGHGGLSAKLVHSSSAPARILCPHPRPDLFPGPNRTPPRTGRSTSYYGSLGRLVAPRLIGTAS